MSQRLPYVQPKGGSFCIRLVVPAALRPFVENGKGEILRSLGNSLREVKAHHARALASAQDELEAARKRKAQAEGIEVARGTDDDITRALGGVLARFEARWNLDAQPKTNEWRQTARTLAFAEYEALSRVAERDEGDFSGRPAIPALLVDEPDPLPAITFDDILDDEVNDAGPTQAAKQTASIDLDNILAAFDGFHEKPRHRVKAISEH